MTHHNPLITRRSTIPFLDLKAEHVEPAIEHLLKEATEQLTAIKTMTEARTFKNTMLPFDDLGLNLDFAMSIVGHIESVATTPEWRAAYNAVLPKVTEFTTKLTLDEKLWEILKAYSESPETTRILEFKKRYLQKTLDTFKRNGAELPPEKKELLAEINTELSRLTTSFSQNTLDATNAFEYVTESIDDLKGLPESALQMGRSSAAAKKREGWRYTLQAPSYIAIMTHADDANLRKMFYQASNSRCVGGDFDNVQNLYRVLELRREKAELLGFQDFSDLVLEDRMAKSGAAASDFVRDLREKIKIFFETEQEELKQFYAETTGADPSQLQPWDLAYYAEKMRKARYDFDEEALRPYFPLPAVLAGLFHLVDQLFGISVKPSPSLSTWDPSVTAYSVYDSDSDELLGYFYADLHPRENKRGGAWMNSLVTSATRESEEYVHVGLIAGNFTPPTQDSPSLLTHQEVTTLFHEFGHLMHLLCSTTELRGQGMNAVAWDFIELPSQILENWCWDKQSVDLIAAHWKTGEKIPDELFAKVHRARNFRAASHLMRQLGFSTLDLELHRSYSRSRDGDILEYARGVLSAFFPLPLPSDFGMVATFTHLFSSPVGYASGYYSYQWAEVLDADAFSRFEKEGIWSRTTGMNFREIILSNGDSEDPSALFRRFMDREPDTSALLRREGLVVKPLAEVREFRRVKAPSNA